MDKKSSMSRIERQKREKVLRFSIRKYSFGAASVAVAALMFLGARVVSADSVTPVEQPHVEALTQDTSPLASQDKEKPTSSIKVDTAVASQLVVQLKDQLHVKETANTDLLVRAKEELVKAEQTLANSKVSQEEVDALVARLTNVLDQLRAVETPQVKEDKNGESTQEATPEIKPEVAKPTPEISAKSEETSENTNAEQLEKAKASLKLSIERLEQTIAQTPENELTREILEKAIAQVAVAKSAFGGVEVSLRDVEDMNRVIKRNESSVMIARNRLTSGHNDVRNRAAIPVGTRFRADEGVSYKDAVGLYFTKEGDGSGYPAGTMLFRDRNQDTADKQRVKDVKDVVKVDVTKNGDIYDWVIEFDRDPEGHKNAHAWFTLPKGHELVNDGSASFSSYWGGSGGTRRIETQGRLPRTLLQIFQQQLAATSKVINIGTPDGDIETAQGKKTKGGFWSGSDGVVNTLEEIIANPNTPYWHRTGGDRTTTEKDVLVSDYLKDWLIQHTEKVYHFEIDYRSKLKASTSNYIFRFKTKAAEGTPLFYAAGLRSYEFNTHRNDMQWYGLPSPKVTGADQTIEKGKEIRLEFTTTDNLAGFSNADPKLGYNPATSITLEDSKLTLENQKVEVQKVSDHEHKLIITGRVASEPSETGYQVKVKSVNNVGQSAVHTATVKVTAPSIDAEKNNPTPQDQTVNVGETPDPKKSIGNVGDLPKGTTVEYKTPVDTKTPGDKETTAVVTYPDGSKDEVPVTVKVVDPRKDAEKNNPTPQDQTVNVGETPDPKKSIGNVGDLPKGTTVEYKTPVDTKTPGDKETTAVVTYPDGSKDEVPVTVKVVDPRKDAEKNNPTPQEQTVNVGETPDPKKSIGNVGDLPKGTTVEYKTPVDTKTPGDKETTAVVTYPDGSKDEVPVTVKVVDPRKDAEKNNPTPQDQTVNVGETPDPKKSIGNVGDLPKGTTVEYKTPVDTKTPGDKETTAVVTYPDGSKDEVPVTVKVVDPRKDAEKNNPTPQEQTVNVGETPDPKKSIGNVGDLPKGTTVEYKTPVDTKTPGDKETTAVVTYPDGSKDEVPVTVKVVDPRKDAEKNNPTPQDQTVNVGETPDPKKSIGNVGDLPKGTTVEYKTPVDTKTPGDKETTAVVTYPDGSKDEVPVTVKVVDPRKDAEKNNPTPQEQTVNVGETPDPKKSIGNVGDLPKGTTVEYKTPVDTKTPGDKETTAVVTYPDGSKDEVPVTVKVVDPRKDAEKNNPTPQDQTVNVGETPDPKKSIGNVGDLPKGTTVEYKTPVDTKTPGDKETTAVVTYPDGSKDEVPVTVKVVDPRKDAEKNNPTPQDQTVNVGETPDPKKSIGNVGDLPKGTTVEYKTPVDTKTPGDKETTAVVTYPDGSKDEVPVTVKVVDPRKDAEKNNPTLDVEQDPKTGDVTVTPKQPDGSTYPPGTKVEIPGKDKDHPITVTTDENGKAKVPNADLPEGKVPGTGKITEPGKPAVEVPVETPAKVTPETPAQKTPTVELEQDPKTGDVTVTPKQPDGSTYPPGTKVEIPGKDKDHPITVTTDENGKAKVPNADLPEGKVPGTGKITEPGKPAVEVPVETPAKVTPETPAQKTPTVELEQDPKTGDVTVTPKQPDGSTYPPGTKVEIPGKDKDHPITVTTDENGKAKVPNADLPEGKVPGTGKITEPGKPAVEVPVETPAKVTPETPAQKTPTVELEQDPKTGDVTVTPKQPDGSTYPPGTKVEIPGKDKDHPITVTTDENGKAKVPNADLPEGKVPGTGKITEPGKPAVEVPVETPAKVTPETPAQKTPTVELEQDPKTGDVTVTPKQPDGSTYPPGTKVEIPGKDKDHPITVTTDENGKAKVPNADLPEGKVPGTGKITEPGKPAVEVPVETPAKVTPETPAQKTPTVELEQDPKTGDVTVTPKQPDGSTYPPGTKVEIPGKDKDHPITVTTDENGKGKVPNADLPEGKVPGTGKITEPGKPAVEVPVETPAKVTPETPAQKTPTVELEQDPKTGDVTVTPKQPDGSTYPPGTKVEIPGKDKDHPITVTTDENGKAKVPNADLPEGKVPGTGKITEPGKPAVEVPVETPAKVTPETPAQKTPTVELEQDPKTGDVTVTPKQPDGSTYPPGTKVEIPGKDKDHPITVTTDENGKAKVPNADLPEGKVPGTGKITEPGKPAVEVPVETPAKVTPETPAQKTPTVELEQDPKTGDVTVTPKQPDGSTYKPGTKVEIPGENGPITVEIGEDGKGKVPNDKLPKKDVPGTAKITEPGQPTVEVPVTTPGKVTPATPTDTNPVAPVTPDTPVKPDTNGGSGQDVPAPTPATPTPTTPTPNVVTPNADQVDTKTTVDNGAKSNDSQNVLPNTGTESNATLASLGLLGMLGGLGLVARKKKED